MGIKGPSRLSGTSCEEEDGARAEGPRCPAVWRLRESAAVPGSKRGSVVDQCDLEQVPDLSASVTLALKWGQ